MKRTLAIVSLASLLTIFFPTYARATHESGPVIPIAAQAAKFTKKQPLPATKLAEQPAIPVPAPPPAAPAVQNTAPTANAAYSGSVCVYSPSGANYARDFIFAHESGDRCGAVN